MRDSQLGELLSDAKRIASYGQRSGRLKNSGLFLAIQNVEAKRRLNWGDPEATDLQIAIANAAEEIRPVTLVDLRSGWDPFRKMPTMLVREMFSRAAFILFAASLMVFSIYYTQWQKEAEHVVSLHEQGAAARQADLISETYEIYLTIKIEDMTDELKNPASAASTELRKNLLEIQSLQSNIFKNSLKYEFVLENVNIIGASFRWINSIISFNNANKKKKTDNKGSSNSQSEIHDVQEISSDQESEGQHSSYHRDTFQGCVNSYSAETEQLDQGRSDIFREVSQSAMIDQAGFNLVRCVAGVSNFGGFLTYDERDLNGRIELVSLWLLPCLFGMLGAVIFHLRACLNRLRPDPSFGRALMRTFLGGFGGVAFGWFWSPEATDELIATTLPLGAYAVAFLIGYSIDVFSAMIDKLVVLVTGAIENIGRKNQPNGATV